VEVGDGAGDAGGGEGARGVRSWRGTRGAGAECHEAEGDVHGVQAGEEGGVRWCDRPQ